MIIRSFEKCGLLVAPDRSENAQVTINGLWNYERPPRFVEEEFNLLNGDEDDAEDANESNKFDLLPDQQVSLVVEHCFNLKWLHITRKVEIAKFKLLILLLPCV